MDQVVRQKVQAFFDAYPLKSFDKKQILVQAGDEPPGVMYVVEGQVRQYDITAQGEEIVVNVFQSPAYLPMAWAITGAKNRYFYEAATPVAVRIAPAVEVIAFVKANPDVMFDLLSRVYSGVEGMQRRMAHLMGGTARTRVAYELLIECKRFGERRPDGSFLVNIHEEELARRAGLSRETVNRELSKLKRDKLLKVSHKQLLIQDVALLEQALGDEV